MVDPDAAGSGKKILAILSGSKVTVWDLPPSPILGRENSSDADPGVRSFDPYPQSEDAMPISSLAWNHNQMVIATSSGIPTDEFAHDNVVLLSSQSGQKLDSFQHDWGWKQKRKFALQQEQQWQESSTQGSIVNSISFGGKSRYLCIGDESGAVCLWDLKKKVRVRQFFHNPIGGAGDNGGKCNFAGFSSLQVSLDPTDTYVMSLSPRAMYQYNLRDGQLLGSLEVPKDDDSKDKQGTCLFTVFAISNLEPNICAIGTSGGNIYLYDISAPHGLDQTSTPHAKIIRRHNGRVTGLVFSPENPNTFLSSGTDGIVYVHNKSNGTRHKVCSAPDTNNPIQTLSLHADGVTCAIGCRSGDVYVYDLQYIIKGGDMPAPLLATHQSSDPINSLVFAPPPKAKDPQKPKSGIPSEQHNEEKVTQQKEQQQQQQQQQDEKRTKQQENFFSNGSKPPSVKASAADTTDKTPKSASKISSASATEKIKLPLSSPKKTPPFLFHKNLDIPTSPKRKKSMTDEVREVVREEVENLQDEMEEQFRNLHIDVINQFHRQSQEFEAILSKHMAVLERLSNENQLLREENERFRRGEEG
ncbi:unnamed protein product [Pseudo-nitzschia multistriata]|uniref:Uncharacterized protein n=1 Tax=Pseudo-nitzschia multistriata TaxID=183589 RepID=A0A448Z7E5_9STRA|nr:unnamed protein product [Pseudo-nitzschia multistriata]